MGSVIQSALAGTYAFVGRQADRVVSPAERQRIVDHSYAFGSAHPLLSALILAQAATALLPLLLFAAFSAGVVLLAQAAALLFCLFWIGAAALVLGAALFVAFGLGLFLWASLVGAYLALRLARGLVFGGPAAGAGRGGRPPSGDGGDARANNADAGAGGGGAKGAKAVRFSSGQGRGGGGGRVREQAQAQAQAPAEVTTAIAPYDGTSDDTKQHEMKEDHLAG